MTTRTSHFDALTGLRFFAAAAIIVHHIDRGCFYPGDFLPFICMGAAVPLFFTLSGFVLTPINRNTKVGLIFYVARVARIYPTHLATIGLLWLAFYPYSYELFEPPYLNAALLNVSLTQAWAPSLPDYYSLNAPAWSVSCEIFFYALFPLLAIWMRSRAFLKAAGLYVGIMVTLWLISDTPMTGETRTWFGYINPISNLPAFCFGIAFGRLYQSLGTERKTSNLAQLTALGAALGANVLAASLFTDNGSAFQQFVMVSGATPVYGLLLLVLVRYRGSVSRFLSLPLVVYCGEISYSLYLAHQVVFRWWLDTIKVYAIKIPLPLNVIAAVLTCVFAAVALHHLVERPARRLIILSWKKVRDLRLGQPTVEPTAPALET